MREWGLCSAAARRGDGWCGSTCAASFSTTRGAIGVLRASTSRRCCGRVRVRAVRGAVVLGAGWLVGARVVLLRARSPVCGSVSGFRG